MSDLVIIDCEQGSQAWIDARLGLPTASNFAKILAKGEGKTRRRYILDLASEILTSEVSKGWEGNEHTERGHAMEDEARSLYAFQCEVEPIPVGFMRRGRVGASPDSLIGENGLLEIKTKLGALQLDVLEQDRLPPEHVAQVQGQLWISGREFCDFVSYWPKLPLFVKRVERNEKYIAMLAQAIADFNGELDAIVAKYSTGETKRVA